MPWVIETQNVTVWLGLLLILRFTRLVPTLMHSHKLPTTVVTSADTRLRTFSVIPSGTLTFISAFMHQYILDECMTL